MNNIFNADPEQIEPILKASHQAGLHVIMVGPPGTGKSWSAKTLGMTRGSKPVAVYLTEDSARFELVGYDRQVGGDFVLQDGPAPIAWIFGRRLVIDEIDKCPPAVMSLLLAVLDDPKLANLILPDGREITPKKGFHAVCTSNVESLDELPEALLDRISVRLYVDKPHPNAYLRLPEDIRDIARLSGSAEGVRRTSLRDWIAVDKLRTKIGDETLAFKSIFGDEASGILTSLEAARTKLQDAGVRNEG